jgi:hypothetical protein
VDDIVTAVDGDKVDAERTLRDRLLAYEPGDEVTLDVLRGSETMQIDVTLGQFEMPADVMPFFKGKGGLPFEFRLGPLGPLFRQPAPPQSNTDSNARRL